MTPCNVEKSSKQSTMERGIHHESTRGAIFFVTICRNTQLPNQLPEKEANAALTLMSRLSDCWFLPVSTGNHVALCIFLRLHTKTKVHTRIMRRVRGEGSALARFLKICLELSSDFCGSLHSSVEILCKFFIFLFHLKTHEQYTKSSA